MDGRVDSVPARRGRGALTGASLPVGMDEVGRGAMAGPLVAAAVALPPHLALPAGLAIVDSKRLTAEQRMRSADWIASHAALVAVEAVGVEAINRLGIGWANRHIYARLMARIGARRYLVDGNLRLHDLGPPGSVVVCRCGGDAHEGAIAAASIVAKHWRDRLMQELHQTYPCYGWARNAGYATVEHRRAIQEVGPSPHHRMLYLRRVLSENDG